MILTDTTGYYGSFGGAYIPELLRPNTEALQQELQEALKDATFETTFRQLLCDYVGRPTPLSYAARLSEKYKARIFLKREDLNHTGSHKINNAIGQVLLAQRMGKTRIIAETGAGQHGVATATVCALMDLDCVVYMGAEDIQRQSANVARMQMLGAEVRAVHTGSRTLKDATNEAIRDWINHPDDTYYMIGSVVGPHPYPAMVAYFQSVISEEIQQQLLAATGLSHPDYVLACVGGGSNAAGAFYHFIGNKQVQLIGAEAAGKGCDTPHHAATVNQGSPGIIHGSHTLLLQNTDGQIREPYSISAGLDYPGIGPLHAHLAQSERAKYLPVTDAQALEAAQESARLEGIIPALETAHALALLPQLHFEDHPTVVLCLSGRGDKDMPAYQDYFNTTTIADDN
jgi:tryptophan synthase beta chain